MMIVKTDNAPEAQGPYSQAVIVNDTMYVSGMIPIDPATGNIPDTTEEQASRAIDNVLAVISAQKGFVPVKVTVYLTDINDFAKVNGIYAEKFSEPYPARVCIQVSAIPKGCKIMVDAIAVH